MSEFKTLLNEQLKDEDFKKEWDSLALRYSIVEQLLKLRQSYHLTQKQFAQKVGTTQAVISRIENGSVNIGIDFIEKVAKAFNKNVKMQLV